MGLVRGRLLALLRREEGAISIEYAALVVVGVILVGVLLTIAHSEGMRSFLTGMMTKVPA